jgi:hypothetical protein
MQWLLDNWIWILIVGGFIALHMFGHGGHGSRGKRGGQGGGGSCCGGKSKTESESQPNALSKMDPSSKSGGDTDKAKPAEESSGA